jgi:hypothetical protein
LASPRARSSGNGGKYEGPVILARSVIVQVFVKDNDINQALRVLKKNAA